MNIINLYVSFWPTFIFYNFFKIYIIRFALYLIFIGGKNTYGVQTTNTCFRVLYIIICLFVLTDYVYFKSMDT